MDNAPNYPLDNANLILSLVIELFFKREVSAATTPRIVIFNQ